MEQPLRQLVWDPTAESREVSALLLATLVPGTGRAAGEVTSEGLLLHASSELDLEIVVDILRATGRRLEVGKPQINYIRGTPWHEPYAYLDITLPADRIADIHRDLQARRAEVRESELLDNGQMSIGAFAPMAELFGYATSLRLLTGGQGSFVQEFREYRPLPRL